MYHFEDWLRPRLEGGALEPVVAEVLRSVPLLPRRRLVPAPLRAFVDFVQGGDTWAARQGAALADGLQDPDHVRSAAIPKPDPVRVFDAFSHGALLTACEPAVNPCKHTGIRELLGAAARPIGGCDGSHRTAKFKEIACHADDGAERNPITQYVFWDTGAGGGHFVLGGVAQRTNQAIDVTAAQLSQLSYWSGSDADTLWVKASDGALWSDWSAPFTVTGPADTGPVVTGTNLTAAHGQAFAGVTLFTFRDPYGLSTTQYDVWNSGTGGGHFVLGSTALAPGQDNVISAIQLAQLSYISGSGTDTLWVRANDGQVWGQWSNAFTVTAPVDTGPVITPAHANITALAGNSVAATSLFTYSDPFGSKATQYDVWNSGTGGGEFLLAGAALAANQDNIISAAQLAQLTYQLGTGTDTLWVRANDGTVWGNWSQSFTATGQVDTGPVETVANLTALHGQSFAASSLFTYSDAFGKPATQYDVWNNGTGGGHFVLGGAALAASQDNIITAAQLVQLSYQSGSGADTLWVRANDGTAWGPWSQSFTVTAPVDTGPVVTPTHAGIESFANQTFAASSLVTYSDPFGSPATQYDVWNSGGGGGTFLLNGAALPANQDNIVTAAQFAQLSYQVGTGTDTLWVRANDGTVWGAWTNGFTISDPPAVAAGETITLGSAFAGTVDFLGDTGLLRLENSASFAGTVAGLRGQDAIDFADIAYAAGSTLAYQADGSSAGTLSVSDGHVIASIALLGNYMASSFVAAGDGHGGTLISETAAAAQSPIAQAHA